MSSETLYFQSPPLRLGLIEPSNGASLVSEVVIGFIVRELYEPGAYPDIDPDIGRYQVRIEREVSSRDEFQASRSQGIRLAQEIERAWAYAWGTPFRSSGFDLALVPVEAPRAWSTNNQELDIEFQRQTQRLVASGISITSRHWRFLSYFPLERALKARAALASADDVTNALVDLHYEAHHAGSASGPEVLLAKALEIVRAVLPGRTDLRNNALSIRGL